MKRKAQVTLFVIVALVVVLLTAVGIYYYRTVLVSPGIVLPQEVVPVKSSIENCLYETASSAVYLAGQQAGYAEVPEQIVRSKNKRLELIQNSEIVMPYWHANGILQIPTKEQMQRQLEIQIEKDVNNCINLNIFTKQFNFIPRGEKKVIVTLNDKNVFVQLKYPLEIQNKQGTKITDIDAFQTTVEKKLLKAYELAKEIMEYENRNVFLERTTIDLLSLDPNVPVSDLKFECKRLEWNKDDIKNSFKETIRENLRLMKVRNTKYDSFAEPEQDYKALERYDQDSTGENIEGLEIPPDLPEDVYEYKHYFIDATTKKYDDISVSFRYDENWPMEMEIRPSDDGRLRSNIGKGAVKYFHLLCVNFYKFTYDIVYPVIVTVHDDETDYTFQFALPVQVKSNSPKRENFGFEDFEAPQYVKDFCEDAGEQIKITAVDKFLQEERNKVAVSFECGRFYCPLGNTSYQDGGYSLKANLPNACSPGQLIAERGDYLPAKKELAGGNEKIEMIALHDVELSFILKESNTAATRSLREGQKAFVYMNDQKLEHEISLIYPDESNKIKLTEANANYSVEIILTEGDSLKGGMFGNLVYERNEILQSNEVVFNVLQKFPEPITVEQQGTLLQELQENKYGLPVPELR